MDALTTRMDVGVIPGYLGGKNSNFMKDQDDLVMGNNANNGNKEIKDN